MRDLFAEVSFTFINAMFPNNNTSGSILVKAPVSKLLYNVLLSRQDHNGFCQVLSGLIDSALRLS